VVFTSGIVDEWSSSLLVGRSQYYSHLLLAVGVGVEPGWPVGGGEGRDTLLSPEASAVRRVSLGLLGGSAPVRGGSVLVGWFLVNWIVDASIFATIRRPGTRWGAGSCCRVVLNAGLCAFSRESMGEGAVDRGAGVCLNLCSFC
jgi:hypothetical protein